MRTDYVSVIIPCYNRLQMLPRALESVLAQSYTNTEIIVVDDGSTDGTSKWVKETHPQVILITQSNHGVSHARNEGIKIARGDWIALLDSDDAWVNTKLERQMALIKGQDDAPLCHTEEIWYRHNKRVNQKNKHAKLGGYIFEECLALCLISPSSVLIKKTLFNECGYFDETLPACEDYDLWLRITARYPVLFLDEALTLKYGGHRDQLSQQFWGMDRFRIRALDKILRSNTLSEVNRQVAIEMLQKKIKIYCQGAIKRGKLKETQYYEKLYHAY